MKVFNPLAFVFVPFPIVDERPAPIAHECVETFYAHMVKTAADISPEASAALVRQWPELINGVLLKTTCEAFAALRNTMPLGLN